jgi:hypothetical protein
MPKRKDRTVAAIGARLNGNRVHSLPPCGGGMGWGVVPWRTEVPHLTTPTPDPSPQSKSAVADFDCFIKWPKPAYTRFRLGGEESAAASNLNPAPITVAA